MKVLVVDDDRPSLKLTSFLLNEEGYVVTVAEDGRTALDLIAQDPPDLVILDVMMPHIDGFDVCRHIRKTREVPIIFLSAKNQVGDKVAGLRLGADDYLSKPFEPAELLARVEAVLRRSVSSAGRLSETAVRAGGIYLDPVRQVAFFERNGAQIQLTPTEFKMLWYLMRNADRVLSSNLLIDRVWGYDFGRESNLVPVYIRRLRSKIEANPGRPERLVTVRGYGYKFQSQRVDANR